MLRVPVANVGPRHGTEVVQLYVRDEVASVARPDQQLVGFAWVGLDPGSSAFVTFEVHPSRLSFYDESMQFVTEPGMFFFTVGGASETASSASNDQKSESVATTNKETPIPIGANREVARLPKLKKVRV